jgi:radical SAM superfamily enzyme YgiQ (UPF0313 family)
MKNNTKFLLVNPYYNISECPSPPLGLAFLAAVLERAGVEVKVLDLVVFPYGKKMLKDLLEDFSPQVVCATSVTMTFDNAIKVIQDVKTLQPGILTVMGGPHVTFCAKDTMNSFPELDIVVLGEGEETIVDLAKAVEKGEKPDNIKGLVYRSLSGEIVSTGEKKPSIDVDSLPLPARHLLPLGRYRALNMCISMTTSRGCPFKCIFCVGRKMVGAKVRYRDPKRVVDELEYLSTLNFCQINIADDLFTANKRHCFEVCTEIIKRGLNIKWTSFARVDTVSTEVLAKMKEAGCTTVSFGVESGNPEILKTIKKGITLKQVTDAVKMCTQTGITPHASFILGLPGETPETLKETVAFGEKLRSLGVSHGFHLLAPFPGTETRDKCKELGIKILTNDWSQYHANRAIVETPSVDRKMLDEIAIQWEKKYDRFLAKIGKLMKDGKATEFEASQVINLERTVLIYDLMMGNVLQEKGSWAMDNPDASDHDLLKALIKRLPPSDGFTREKMFHILDYAVGNGSLKYTSQEGIIKWQWVDYL